MYSHYEHECEQALVNSRMALRGGVSRKGRAADSELLDLVRQSNTGSNTARPTSRRHSVGMGGGHHTLPLRPSSSAAQPPARLDNVMGSIIE